MSFWYTFDGTSLPSGTTNGSTGTGAVSVASGVLSLAAGTSGLAVLSRSAAGNFSVNGTIRAIHLPVNGGAGAICAGGRSSTPTQRIPVVGRLASGNVFGGFYRDSDGYPIAAFSVAYTPWVRLRRSGTNIIFETSTDSTTGVDGTWTSIGSYADDDLWSAAALASVTEVVVGEGNATHTVSAWGDPSSAGPTPTISSIAPTSGAVGTEITITGTNLTGTSAGTMGPTVALTGIVVDSATQVRATIAAGSPASGTIRLTTPGGTAVGPTFTITPIYTDVVVTNPNSSAVIGVLLAPITARAIDQFGNTFLGTVPADGAIPAGFCGVDELALGYAVTGTTVEAFVAGTATFDNLTPIEDSGGPPIEVITVATPLRCTVTLYPKTSAPIDATGGGGIPTLLARVNSDHILRVQTVRHDVTNATVEPDKLTYAIADASSVLLSGELLTPTSADDWQIPLSKTLFTPTRGALTLTLTLIAPTDLTQTQLQFLLALGVRQ